MAPFSGGYPETHHGASRLLPCPLKLTFMKGDSNLGEETARASLPMTGRRDGWLEQRLGYLAGEQARLKGDLPLGRFLRGAMAAYRRFLRTADPAHRFQCWATIRTVSAGLDPQGPVDRLGLHRPALPQT
jgi:hypothetical protein